ncbi:hypothetical protein GCM10010922_02120 [Microbacterium sorbitolivorans]|nr:hypothetical protein GCM10010922_02120 [Microbacterium sorbitolivorans]
MDAVGVHALSDEARAHRRHEGERPAQVDLGIALERELLEVDAAGVDEVGGRRTRILIPAQQRRRRHLVDDAQHLGAVRVGGGGAVGVHDVDAARGSGAVQVLQEAEDRGEPDAGRDE